MGFAPRIYGEPRIDESMEETPSEKWAGRLRAAIEKDQVSKELTPIENTSGLRAFAQLICEKLGRESSLQIINPDVMEIHFRGSKLILRSHPKAGTNKLEIRGTIQTPQPQPALDLP